MLADGQMDGWMNGWMDNRNPISHLAPAVQNQKLLANVRLKFLPWNMANTLISFAEKKWEKSFSHFSSKNIKVFENALNATTIVSLTPLLS